MHAYIHTYIHAYIHTYIHTGYRGAQCGWLIVEESNVATDESTSRQALCLCVYLPKRGLLEVQYIHTHILVHMQILNIHTCSDV